MKMKQIRTLQILVYIVFVLLLIQNLAGSIYTGAIDGWNAAGSTIDGKSVAHGRLLPGVVLDNKLVTNNATGELKAGKNYTLSNINVSADIRLEKPQENETPFWFDLIKFVIVALECGVLFKIVRSINDVIKLIAQNEMFSEKCIGLVRTTGTFILAFPSLDYAFEWISYFEHKLILGGKLNVVNTASFSFEILLLAIFVFIIAEAFKQGAKLKEQQDLTI
jgi:hypothetical protein